MQMFKAYAQNIIAWHSIMAKEFSFCLLSKHNSLLITRQLCFWKENARKIIDVILSNTSTFSSNAVASMTR